MKRLILHISAFILGLFTLTQTALAKTETLTPDNWDYNIIASSIDSSGAPYVKGEWAVFTADKNARHVGIAFDFENYRQIHSFKLRTIRDEQYNITDSFYFYIFRLPKNVQKLNYRLVIDGLWTTDPENPVKVYDEQTDLYLSSLDVSRNIPEITEQLPSFTENYGQSGNVRFIYRGDSGLQIRLGGSFTNWDSWIYELEEIEPGLYELDLSLPPGKYYYNYYCGMKAIVDTTNPDRVYTADGREASQILVK